ncbi:hypothetical protein JX265_013347 [Neoarthrinium moseri]|uniref:C2H2-type domain-containing protein n=1 Tax=Neoarthrinium moseri TaxID=1658444 RepID=A0A9Q0AIU2_9PEZI|nr:hypothetical protein JX266_006762 [Neoarthrinium moseri]KAI1850784.1 hypothetical protein JX265_013347 [Neoarthrinium moseri]
MEQGLDELIEWLLTEIGFSGLEGFSALDLVKAVKAFYRERRDADGDESGPSGPASIESQEVDATDAAHASIVWKWLVARKDVIVVPSRVRNMSLDEALALSQDGPTSSMGPPESLKDTPQSSQSEPKRKSSAPDPNARPRLFLSEERQWKAIAGHGPDLKRLPQFEWKALVAIASVKEKGILQGDLTRLTGQDKRSLPMRTDALARKGYIIKQSAMLRGCRTSKLWLAQFGQNAKADVVRQGLPPEILNMPAEELTASWDPVSFTQYYTNDTIDYIAISQTFLMILKAYKAMRYCDLRAKMDIKEKVPQMRALAKSSRWWARAGVLRFEPMESKKSNKLFKDCMKFVRDPTPEEWAKYRTTPKANLKVPTSRVRKNKKGAAAPADPSADTLPPSRRLGKKPLPKRPTPEVIPSPALIRLSGWTPYKPMVNTVQEIIRRAGPEGSSNVKIGMFTLGWPYRKWVSTLTSVISLPRPRPAHVQAFIVESQLKRVGKTNTYKFVATGALKIGHQDQTNEHEGRTIEPPAQRYGPSSSQDSKGAMVKYTFPAFSPKAFLKPGRKVSGYLIPYGARKGDQLPTKRKRDGEEEISVPIQKRPRVTLTADVRHPSVEKSPEPQIVRPPGVHYGKKNSLDPYKPMGRPRKSVVLIFNSPALKDPNFFTRRQQEAEPKATSDGVQDAGGLQSVIEEDSINVASTPNSDTHESRSQAEPRSVTPVQKTARPKRGRWSAGGPKSFKCDKCGKSWKNPNGLEYHQTKSQSPCNPDYVAPPPKAMRVFTPKLKERSMSADVAEETDEALPSTQRKPSEAPRNVLPSRRPKRAAQEIDVPAPVAAPPSRNATHRQVRLHNVLDLPTAVKSRSVASIERSPRRGTESPLANTTANKRFDSPVSSNVAGRPLDRAESIEPPATTLSLNSRRQLLKGSQSLPMDMNGENLSSSKLGLPGATSHTSQTPNGSLQRGKKTSKKPRPDAATKQRMFDVVQRLLDQNDDVLPGDESLFLLVLHRWSEGSGDSQIGPPDRTKYDKLMKAMERDKIIHCHTYSLPNNGGAFKTISVIFKPSHGGASEDISKRIDQVKSKCIELYPEPYIPAKVAIPRSEYDSLRALGEKDTDNAPHLANVQGASKSSDKKIATLEYELPVDLNAKSKAPAGSGLDTDSPGRRRTRLDADDSDEPHRLTPRKRRKLRSADDFSAVGRSSQPSRQDSQQDGEADHAHSYLQDPATGAWSSQPQMARPTARVDAEILTATPRTRKATTPTPRRRIRRGRKAAPDPAARGDIDDGDVSWDVALAPAEVIKAFEASSTIQFLPPTTPAEFAKATSMEDDMSEDDDEDDEDLLTLDDDEDHLPKEAAAKDSAFTTLHSIVATGHGVWPGTFPRSYFMDRPGGSFTMVGSFPDSRWLLRQNLPQNVREMVENVQLTRAMRKGIDRVYGDFGRDVTAIETWEMSPEGIYLQNRGTIAPDHIFISLASDPSEASMEPVTLEWPEDTQYTIDTLPNEIKYGIVEDDGGQSLTSKPDTVTEMPKRAYRRRNVDGESRQPVKRSQGNWKARTLSAIPKRSTGRWNKQRAIGDNLGRNKETELLVAIVIIRKLLGGVDKITDWGLIIKLYPEWSLSGIKRFWNRICRERANYIEALSKKFDSAYLDAYEKNEVPSIDYDDLDNYDWRTVIAWATKLETHDGVELPVTRRQFNNQYKLSEPKKDEENWRETWYHFQSSTFVRTEGAAGQHATLPATKPSPSSTPFSTTEIHLAMSWVRALCDDTKGITIGTDIRATLLKRWRGDKASLDELLDYAITKLLESKVISRLYGKGRSRSFRLNTLFENRAKKFANLERFTQAISFKAELDKKFRSNEAMILPYNANDGAIMAMINLQAYGRVRLADDNFPVIPHGFKPGDYEGRKYPKRYYQWDVKLMPTDKYVYDEDLPLVMLAKDVVIPKSGPLGEIPGWYDFFGNLDHGRWVQYLCMMVFALATKGPMTAESAVSLLAPTIEAFEAQLIIDWLDGLGVVQRLVGNRALTVGEWWWLVTGRLASTQAQEVVEE